MQGQGLTSLIIATEMCSSSLFEIFFTRLDINSLGDLPLNCNWHSNMAIVICPDCRKLWPLLMPTSSCLLFSHSFINCRHLTIGTSLFNIGFQPGVNYPNWVIGPFDLCKGCLFSISILTTTYFIEQKEYTLLIRCVLKH